MKTYFRMESCKPYPNPVTIPAGISILSYDSELQREHIPALYAAALHEKPWPADWDNFSEYDPQGIFVAVEEHTRNPVGFIISFQRQDFGYISVIAVLPEWQQKGIATVLIAQAFAYLRGRGLGCIYIDVEDTNLTARRLYERAGFQDVKTFQE